MVFGNRILLDSHKRKLHLNPNKYTCLHCKKGKISMSVLKAHIRNKHYKYRLHKIASTVQPEQKCQNSKDKVIIQRQTKQGIVIKCGGDIMELGTVNRAAKQLGSTQLLIETTTTFKVNNEVDFKSIRIFKSHERHLLFSG